MAKRLERPQSSTPMSTKKQNRAYSVIMSSGYSEGPGPAEYLPHPILSTPSYSMTSRRTIKKGQAAELKVEDYNTTVMCF